VQRGAEVNALGDEGRTALHVAARQGHASVTKQLLQHGADVSMPTQFDRWTPLHGPGLPWAFTRPSRLPQQICFLWRFCVGAQGA
jgi:ankyrin repeat protein